MSWDDQVVPVLQVDFSQQYCQCPFGWIQSGPRALVMLHTFLCPGCPLGCSVPSAGVSCAPSWEQARMMGTRELTPALRKLVSESMTLLDILLVLMNCIK